MILMFYDPNGHGIISCLLAVQITEGQLSCCFVLWRQVEPVRFPHNTVGHTLGQDSNCILWIHITYYSRVKSVSEQENSDTRSVSLKICKSFFYHSNSKILTTLFKSNRLFPCCSSTQSHRNRLRCL